MSEIMRPLSLNKLMKCLDEYKNRGTIFGVRDIYRYAGKTSDFETGIGLAAGPNTQLAQNIIAGYAAGARYFEVKTVQVMDGAELSRCIPRPCILSKDEGYNVEWSTELTVKDALSEYVRAYFALNVIAKRLGLGKPGAFLFNMSVGYDLAGIKSQKIDEYIEGMKNAVDTDAWKECIEWSKENGFDASAISPEVSNTVTLSTLHGCPKDEIERIASYLIREKHLNTYVKCNPTLLDYAFARKTMDDLGYEEVAFDDDHFKADLSFADAVPMFERLIKLAENIGVTFGVKLSNTLPVKTLGALDGEEMYMSGKSLYPLTISLAARIADAFDGNINISYCAGADWQNCADIYNCGVSPITMATTLLKPGGYNRLAPIARELEGLPKKTLDTEAIKRLSEKAVKDARYARPVKTPPAKKKPGKPPIIDCFTSPCKNACPISQDIPAYMEKVEAGDYSGALEIILERNPLPNITGTICAHFCQGSCTRAFYDDSVEIRSAKLEAAQKGMDAVLETLGPANPIDIKIAVIGGGPAGMAAAFLAAKNGAKVVLFEKSKSLGGTVSQVIPDFRIPQSAIDADAKLLEKLGVDIRLESDIKSRPEGFDYIISAIGAQKHREAEYESVNAIEFLKSYKKGICPQARNCIVVGGGNTAMDAARAAKRLYENVTIVYRRTVREMPADLEELKLAMDEGVKFMPLYEPKSASKGTLTLSAMRLGEAGKDKRRAPVPTGETCVIPADLVILAIGETADKQTLDALQGDFVIGDAKSGPATVVEAIADATSALLSIMPLSFKDFKQSGVDLDKRRQGTGECINCPGLCTNCVDVCPNRANVALNVDGATQILHIDALCNECGACSGFCPYEGRPNRDKFTVFSRMDDFEESYLNDGFLPLDCDRYLVRLSGRVSNRSIDEIPERYAKFIKSAMAVM